jgi:hypothetical protein
MTKEKPRIPPTQETLAAVGDVITTWSALEAGLTQHLVHLVSYKFHSDESYLNAFLLVTGMSVETMLGLLKTLVRMEYSPVAADDFDRLANCVSDAYKNRRNKVAHKMWGAGSKEDRLKVWDIKAVGTFKMDSYEITAKELRSWAQDFRDLSHKVEAFLVNLGVPHPSQAPLVKPQGS